MTVLPIVCVVIHQPDKYLCFFTFLDQIDIGYPGVALLDRIKQLSIDPARRIHDKL